jgi:phosphoglycolate phosphatase
MDGGKTMKKGIIFDMDGTLWDSSVQVCEAWDVAVAKCGYQREPITQEEMQGVMGKTMDVIAEILFPNVEGEARETLLKVCCAEENDYLCAHGGVLYPNIRPTMEALIAAGYHLYIVSNCQSGYIEAFLDHYRMWDLVEDIECYGNNMKQKADNIALIVQRNQLEDAVYVGDIQGDYDSSCKAGVKFIHAAYGFGTINTPVPEIHAFEELPETMEDCF